jgi:4-aminobutyrate aminotransferase-like enzyme
MMGVEIESGSLALAAVKGLLQEGIIALPDGPQGDVVAFTPPFCVSPEEIDFALKKLREQLATEYSE